ncbi:MAG: M48 family metallopeptidase [Deltaproteobacteria bacterium]|nr:M48 family metallopeptidase [Deltaproteobacteria bacterium]
MAKKIRIHGLAVEYEVIRRDIRYPRLEFKTGKLLLIAPRRYRGEKGILKKHQEWIYKKSVEIDRIKRTEKRLIETRDDDEWKGLILECVSGFAEELGLIPFYVNIIFRKLRSKWGSCSPRGNITFNTMMKFLPDDLIRYIVFHEIAHLIEKRHNKKFWKMIEEKFEDHEEKERELFEYWFLIQKKTAAERREGGHLN